MKSNNLYNINDWRQKNKETAPNDYSASSGTEYIPISYNDCMYQLEEFIDKCEDEEMSNEIEKLRNTNKEILNKIESIKQENLTTRWLIGILVTLFGIVTPIVLGAYTKAYDSNVKSIETSLDSKFDSIQTQLNAINQRLDYQEKLNTLQIERDVNKEFIKSQKNSQ